LLPLLAPPFDPPLAEEARVEVLALLRADERAEVFRADDLDPPDFDAEREPADFRAPLLADDLAADFLAPDFAADFRAPLLADDLAADFLAVDFFAPLLADDLAADFLAVDFAADFLAPDFAPLFAALFFAVPFEAPALEEPDLDELLFDELPDDFAAVFFEDDAALFFAPDFAEAFLPLDEPLFPLLLFADDAEPLVLPAPLILVSLVLDLSSVGIAASFKDLHVQPSRLHKATSLYQASSGYRKVSEVERVRFLWILLTADPSSLASSAQNSLRKWTRLERRNRGAMPADALAKT
jgi:hypothetical protein